MNNAAPSGHRIPSTTATLAVCIATTYLVTLDVSIVNVAFPEIARDFPGTTQAHLSWVVTAYNIVYASLLVVAGKLADRRGRKSLFLTGATLFGLGSLASAFAPAIGWLIAGRALQGLGGAVMAPASLGLMLAAVSAERRTWVMAISSSIGALGIASGPSLGAVLIDLTDWRAAFWINVPVCAAIIFFGRRHLAESIPQRVDTTPDYLGSGLITVALAGLALGISQSESWGWGDARVVASLVIAVVAGIWFVARQRTHSDPVMDLTLFRNRSFTVANVSTLFVGAAFAAFGLNNVLFLRRAWQWSVLEAGLISAIGPVMVALFARSAGRLAGRIGFRIPIVVGSWLMAVGSLMFAGFAQTEPNLVAWIAATIVLAAGVTLVIALNGAASVAGLEPHRFSIGGAVTNTGRQVGTVLGIAVLIAVLGKPDVGNRAAAVTDGRHGWYFVAIVMVISGCVSLLQPAKAKPLAAPTPGG